MNDHGTEPDLRPTDAATGKAMPLREQPGYYAGFSTLAQQHTWDAQTRKVVLQRVEATPAIQYFAATEVRFWAIVFDHLLPQNDRVPARRIPIVNVVDHRLFVNQTVGYRFEDMPDDRAAYKLGLPAIDEEAQEAYGIPFVELDFGAQDAVLKRIHDGAPRAAAAIWKHMSVHRFWQLIISDAIDAYYAHPWAWDEIGFGGPAYPRGYVRLERGDREPWEVCEQRYEWSAPAAARSAETESTSDFDTESEQHRSHVRRGGSDG